VALTVTFTVCNAQQIGLSPADGILFGGQRVSLSRTVRPEQKTTPVLAPFRAVNEAIASRKQLIESPRTFAPGVSEIAMALPARTFALFSCRSKAGETTRGPPLMDPPRSC
jgi:hypothetical protein